MSAKIPLGAVIKIHMLRMTTLDFTREETIAACLDLREELEKEYPSLSFPPIPEEYKQYRKENRDET